MVAANGRHLCILALTGMNFVGVTTILVLHISAIGRHVLLHWDFMFPRRLPQGRRGAWGDARPPTLIGELK